MKKVLVCFLGIATLCKKKKRKKILAHFGANSKIPLQFSDTRISARELHRLLGEDTTVSSRWRWLWKKNPVLIPYQYLLFLPFVIVFSLEQTESKIKV